MKIVQFYRIISLLFFLSFSGISICEESSYEGASYIDAYGYTNCIKLWNDTITVILEPNCGGRVIEYSLNGSNALYVNSEQNGITWKEGGKRFNPCGGRTDIGPERLVPPRPILWLGSWTGEITGPNSARMISQKDTSTGVQLIRDFRLDSHSSHLRFTQTIRNISNETKRYCHWSRTFATGGGICIVPLNSESRFPQGYILYGPGSVMDYHPKERPAIRVRDGFLEVTGDPEQPKFGIDSYDGWLGYITQDNMLFVKRFPAYPERVYGEMASFTISLWYFKDSMCELEPIGPWETIPPDNCVSFSEDWWLLPYDYPKDNTVDLGTFTRYIDTNAPPCE